jgi:glycosyltransferase involved in cell wall biosynthesis
MEAANIPAGIPAYSESMADMEVLNIISVGRISDEKDPILLLKALGSLTTPAHATIIGDYSDESYFKAFQDALNRLPEHIKATHIVSVPPSQMQDYYRRHHVFVSCSKGENFGHAIAEALACGLPCFIGENTPWKGLKAGNAGAELPLDADVFAGALENYQQLSSAEKSEMSRAAHNFAVQSFQPDIYRKQYDALFSMEDVNNE